MIELGLSRISRLVQQSTWPWKAVHIAGTNGKGSIASYVSGLATDAGIRCGRFTSPHLIDRWDCITINDQVVQESLFMEIEGRVRQRGRQLGVDASEFELLTATAFEIFNHEQVEIGVVEVGMGGRLDATNVLPNVLVSVISKIGLDHQGFLGDTLAKIAREKAGILREAVPCVVDGTNDPAVLEVVQSRAEELGIAVSAVLSDSIGATVPSLGRVFHDLDLESHQEENMSCAVAAIQRVLEKLRPDTTIESLVPRLSKIRWPGRLQQISLDPIVDHPQSALLDGAHNGQSAEILGKYVERRLRSTRNNITWIIAVSQGKSLPEILGPLIKSGDSVAVVAFGPVDGMPWVKPMAPATLAEYIHSLPGLERIEVFGNRIADALRWGSDTGTENPLVIAGSLYLVSDVLRLLRASI